MTTDNDVRVIETGTAPVRFARGWHCLGLAADFRDGKPHEIEAFGTKLVVFQGEDDGELHVLNAYCPHMGGNLAHGTVKGDTVACPFHDWRWSGDGKCAAIPYARRVPPRARTRTWHAMERNRQLFVWHDPEGNPPRPEQDIPEIAGIHGPAEETAQWSDWQWNTITIDTNCREIVDNVVDMAHFYYIHYSFPVYFKNVFDGHVATQYMRSEPRPDIDLGSLSTGSLRSDASYFGPSYMIDWLYTEVAPGVEMESVLINCHYPVGPDRFVLQYGAMVKKLPGMSDTEAAEAARLTSEGLAVGFEQDVEIWKNKTRIDNPLLTEEDGPVYQLRRWYEQFYVDAADVKDEMVRRFEFEIDTRRANENWRAEAEANMALRAAATAQPTEGDGA